MDVCQIAHIDDCVSAQSVDVLSFKLFLEETVVSGVFSAKPL